MERALILKNFVSYASQHACEDINYFYKLEHSFAVAQNCETLAKRLHLRDADVDLAWLIGLIHDIGRFAQLDCTSSFKDTLDFDHGIYGYNILSDRLIYDFCSSPADYPLVLKAVRYHNVYELPKNLTSRELLFCNLVRDADIIDIFHRLIVSDFASLYHFSMEDLQASDVSSEVMDSFLEQKIVSYHDVRTAMDAFLVGYAFYFNLVYPVSVELVDKQGYFGKMLEFKFLSPQNARNFEVVKQKLKEFRLKKSSI